MKKTIIALINTYKIVRQNDKLITHVINVEDLYTKTEDEQRALMIGKWELYKERRTQGLTQIGFYQDDMSHTLFFSCIEKLSRKGYCTNFEMSGEDMIKLYSLMIEVCEYCIKNGMRLDVKLEEK